LDDKLFLILPDLRVTNTKPHKVFNLFEYVLSSPNEAILLMELEDSSLVHLPHKNAMTTLAWPEANSIFLFVN